MQENSWWKKAVIYEVYVDKFAKDFKGFADKLDYLGHLGVNCIWILPHYPSPMIDDGYDVSDYRGVRQGLGTLDDFREFTQKAHAVGIKVIIDLVLNHVSVEHPWFKEGKDYFLRSKTGTELREAVNPFSHLKKSNWTFDKKREDYYFSTFYPQQADLNWDKPEVFEEMMGVIDFWIDNGVDGFRLDAAPHLIKREGTNCYHLPEVHDILRRIRRHIDSKNAEVILLAEVSGKVGIAKKYFGGDAGGQGDECHMVFNFPLMSHFYLSYATGDNSALENVLAESSDIPKNCQWANFIGNHDEINLKTLDSADRDKVVLWLDPENKYSFPGTSGVSMRLGTVFEGDEEKIFEAFRKFLNFPGSPVIYYGSEIGMKNLDLPDVPADTRLYVRGDFDWREAENQMADSESLLNRVASLIKGR